MMVITVANPPLAVVYGLDSDGIPAARSAVALKSLTADVNGDMM